MVEIGSLSETGGSAGAVRISVTGEIDAATAPGLTEELDSLCSRGVTCVELELSAVEFFDSSGVAALLAARRSGISLVLVNAPECVLRVLEITGLLGHFARDET